MSQDMTITGLLQDARKIWGYESLTLDQIVICLGVVIGDLHRLARDKQEGKTIDDNEVQKELGNIIFSTIRWCNDLGLDAGVCIERARAAQSSYKKNLPSMNRQL